MTNITSHHHPTHVCHQNLPYTETVDTTDRNNTCFKNTDSDANHVRKIHFQMRLISLLKP